MEFEKFYKEFEPHLKKQVNLINYYPSYLDKDDLFQEISIYLWKVWKNENLKKNSTSYILQGGKFHLKNYIRCADDGFQMLRIDKVINP